VVVDVVVVEKKFPTLVLTQVATVEADDFRPVAVELLINFETNIVLF
jgi:hypothetical protein